MSMLDAVVVGSGPNGLAAAITLARAGRSVRVLEAAPEAGGGLRTEELTLPGFVHDVCSAIHPLAVASPFFRRLPLADHGLAWVHATHPLAHPFDDGTAAVLHHDIDDMYSQFPEDAGRYGRMFGPLVDNWGAFANEILQPMTHVPRHPLLLGRFAFNAVQPAKHLGASFKDPKLGALFGGCASHAILPLGNLLTSTFGMVLMAAGHRGGWPFPRGGASSLARALVSYLESLGGEVETSRPVQSLADLPPHRVAIFDVAPVNLLTICGGAMSDRYRRQVLKYRRGEAVFKLDYALSEPVPWTAEACRAAGTIHVAGTLEELVASEGAVARGRLSERPLALVAQPSVFDATRAPEGKQTLWAYTHVPGSFAGDATSQVEAQIERFAPGFRDTVLERSVMPPRALQEHNANLVGGDIAGGSNGGLQLFFRPRLTAWPYDVPVPGVYLCSAATPPGGGVHGMCGYWAARRALKKELR